MFAGSDFSKAQGGKDETETVLCMDVHCNDCDAYAVNGVCGGVERGSGGAGG